MARPRTSIVWTIDYTQLTEIVNSANSIVEILQKLGLNGFNGNHRTLKARCSKDNIDLESVKKRGYAARISHLTKENRKDDNEVFCENSTYADNSSIKQRLLKLGFEYKCSECPVTDTYNNKPISLQLDHINGVNNDNRLENLRFLCPNCHSQTETFSGKRLKIDRFCQCGNKISKQYSRCAKCANKTILHKSKIIWPDKEYFEKELWLRPTISIAKELGVSDVAVGKHIKQLNLTKPPRGYWSGAGSGN